MKKAFALLVLLASVACYPKRDLPPDQIEKLDDLEKVMDVQATVADPQFKKADAASFTEADWAAFADMGTRLQATSKKTLQFSKGPEFDQLANQIHEKAEALSAAAQAKDTAKAKALLVDIKSTCKTCHSKFR
jgi:cytochrome c556